MGFLPVFLHIFYNLSPSSYWGLPIWGLLDVLRVLVSSASNGVLMAVTTTNLVNSEQR